MSSESDTVHHILSRKSADLQRDTFFFVSLSQKSQLFLGVNQKLVSVNSATIHRWVELMSGFHESEEFFLCPVTVHSAGIMSYYVEPSGPAIEPYSTEPLPPGNYGWYFDRERQAKYFVFCDLDFPAECTAKGFPRLTRVRQRLSTFETHLEKAVPDVFPPAEASVAVARDGNRCRFTGSETDTILAWIIPPVVAWETEEFVDPFTPWDRTPFLVAANIIKMQSELRFHFHNNHFTVDVDDDYRILVLRSMGEAQGLLPTHLPRHAEQNEAVDAFLRLHCRHTLHLMLLGGDIKDVYSNAMILRTMAELGVDHIGSGEREEIEMAPLDDERWQTELGQAILANVLKGRVAQSLYESERSASGSHEDEESVESESEELSPSSSSDDWEEPASSTESCTPNLVSTDSDPWPNVSFWENFDPASIPIPPTVRLSPGYGLPSDGQPGATQVV